MNNEYKEMLGVLEEFIIQYAEDDGIIFSPKGNIAIEKTIAILIWHKLVVPLGESELYVFTERSNYYAGESE